MDGPILVVDDDADSVSWVVEALKLAGYEVLTAANGADALRLISSTARPPCLVLLDLMMPVMSGWDVIASLVRHRARPKVVVMSAYANGGVPAGAVGLLEKPLTERAVIEAVRHWCDQS